jgi:signal transduction histidine kinase/ligand-binding sensor domain-containing protein
MLLFSLCKDGTCRYPDCYITYFISYINHTQNFNDFAIQDMGDYSYPKGLRNHYICAKLIRKMPFSFRLLLFLFLFPAMASGQANDSTSRLFFEQPVTLPHSNINLVTCIFKDSHHIMWFGTQNGLYRYDGLNLRYFGHRIGDTVSLTSNHVLEITEDKKDNLWVALLNGVTSINLTTLQCRAFSNTNKRLGPGNYTNRICIDNEGRIWVGNNEGIFLLDEKKQVFTNVWNNKTHSDTLSAYVTSIVSVDEHRLIAATFHDIILFNKDDHSFNRIHLFAPLPPKDTTITKVFLDSKQKLWIGSWGAGIYTYDLSIGKLIHLSSVQRFHNLPYFYPTSFYETSLPGHNTIWISSSTGLIKCMLDNNDEPIDYAIFNHDKNNEQSIIPDKIESLYLDEDGALWCAGDYGICKCFPFKNNFIFFASIAGSALDIESLQLNKNNYYFINSWYSNTEVGMLIADKEGKKALSPDLKFTDKEDGRYISGVAKDKYKRLWVSSMAGISVLNDKMEVVHQWNKETKGENNLTYYRTSGITIHNDTIWVSCYHHGIDLFDLSFKKLCHYPAEDSSGGLKDNIISSFFNDSKGNFWICGDTRLYKYLPGKGKFKIYTLTTESGGCNPQEMAETENGKFIIASSHGLLQFDPVSEKYSYISSALIEKEQNIRSVAIDKNNETWFLTNKHLAHYIPLENRFILYGQEDGLDVDKGLYEIRTFNGTDFYICQDGRVIKFNCDSLNHTGTSPYLMVSAKANDSDLYSGNNKLLVLPYNKNKLQFEFTGISYTKADQTQYYYQLPDVDKQWNVSYKNSVSYANLAPGNYSFQIKAVNYAGLMSEIKVIRFIITPPYWQTWWFRLLATLGTLSVLFVVIRYISQRNLKERILRLEKETAVTKERNRIAQDMHDDLGSGLTKIAILSEVVKKQMEQPEKALEQLDRISTSSRTLVDNLQDIIWMLNTKHDQLESIALYIREYATKYFEQSDINVLFDYPVQIPSLKIGEEKRRNLFMAVKEALNNIAKHAGANSVKISFSVKQGTLEFLVTDNGKGFNASEIRQFANGLKNMQSRMAQAGGQCTISSEECKGTTISFSLNI